MPIPAHLAKPQLCSTVDLPTVANPTRRELRSAWEEFEARETKEARFARAVDRAQPILQNLYTEGGSWREHGVTVGEVRRRNGPLVAEGAPRLWEELDRMLEDAVRKGWLRA